MLPTRIWIIVWSWNTSIGWDSSARTVRLEGFTAYKYGLCTMLSTHQSFVTFHRAVSQSCSCSSSSDTGDLYFFFLIPSSNQDIRMIAQFVWTTYICFLTVIPLLLEWSLFRKVVTHLTHQCAMSFGIPADLGVVSLALASLYTFVVPELVVQTAALFHSRVSERLKLGFHQLQQLFPGNAATP